MPSHPRGPCGGVCGLGTRLWVVKIFKRCRSLSAAIVIVSFWLCLITMINFESNGQHDNLVQKDDSNSFLRSGAFPNYLALLGFSPTDKRIETPSGVELEARLILRNELRTSITSLQSVVKAQRDGQASNLVKDGIISGRRIQEIKLSQIGGLEAVSRRYEEYLRDGGTERNKSTSFFISNERALIDTKAITMMEIRPDVQTPTKNLEDLRSNWTPEPEERAFHFFPGIPQFERPQTREQSDTGGANSSLDKNSRSKFFSSDRKTGSQDSELPVVMVNYGLHAVEKSINEHFPQSIIEMHNRHSNFYDGSSGGINNHFNEDDRRGVQESRERADRDNSPALSIESAHQFLIDSPTNSDGVTNIQLLRGSRPKSNLQSPVAMQMNVPKRSKEFSPRYVIDSKEYPWHSRVTPDVKYPGQTSLLQNGPSEGNGKLNGSGFIHNREANLTEQQTPRISNLATTSRKVSENREYERGRISGLLVEQEQRPYNKTLRDLSISLTLIGDKKHTEKETAAHRKFQQLDLKYDGFEIYSYNVTASNALPIHREIPDTRPDGYVNNDATITLHRLFHSWKNKICISSIIRNTHPFPLTTIISSTSDFTNFMVTITSPLSKKSFSHKKPKIHQITYYRLPLILILLSHKTATIQARDSSNIYYQELHQ